MVLKKAPWVSCNKFLFYSLSAIISHKRFGISCLLLQNKNNSWSKTVHDVISRSGCVCGLKSICWNKSSITGVKCLCVSSSRRQVKSFSIMLTITDVLHARSFKIGQHDAFSPLFKEPSRRDLIMWLFLSFLNSLLVSLWSALRWRLKLSSVGLLIRTWARASFSTVNLEIPLVRNYLHYLCLTCPDWASRR